MVPSPEEVEGEVLEEDIIEEETTGETETAVEAAAQPVTPAIPSSLRTARAAPTSKPRDSIDDEASGRLRYCISHGPRQDSLSQPQPTQEPQFVVPNRVLSKAVQRHRSSERAKVAQHYRSFVDGALSDVYAAHQSAHVNKARRSNLKCKRELERTTVSGRRRGRENLDAGVFGNFGQERKGQIYGYNPPGGQKRE